MLEGLYYIVYITFSMYLIIILNWNKKLAFIVFQASFFFYLEAFSHKSIQIRASTKGSTSTSYVQFFSVQFSMQVDTG